MSSYSKYSKPQQDASEPKRSAEDRALDRFADMMIQKIETINEDWKKPWFTEGSMAWPKNLDGREYNGMNALMLMMHCEKEGYKLPVFVTFDRVQALNYSGGKGGAPRKPAEDKQGTPLPAVSVNKGEKSFPVFLTTFTVVDSDTNERISYDDYKKLTEDERSKYKVFPKLNVYNVFNLDQTNLKEARPELYQKLEEKTGREKPKMQEGETFSFPAIDHLIKENGWVCPIKPTYGDDAYYSISKKVIVVPEKKQFKNGESFYSTLTHEMAHSTGAEDLLNRLKPATFGSSEYAREELVAELSSALISQRYGMEKCIKEDSIPYLKNWLDSLREEPSFIKTALIDVKKASSMIVDSIEKAKLQIEQNQSEVKQEVQPSESMASSSGDQKTKYAVVCASTGLYVNHVSNPGVFFGDLDKAILFDTREEAAELAKECRSYVSDLRFTVKQVSDGQSREQDRLSDLGVELRGEERTPWLTGKVDGQEVLAEKLSPKEYLGFATQKISIEDLALSHFKGYLSQETQEKIHSCLQH